METTTSARPRRGSLFRRRASTSDTQPKPGLRHAKNASAPSLDPSPAPNYAAGPSTSTDSLLSINGTRANIIPDALESLPSWYNKEIDVPSSIHLIRARYPIHNPAGPRFYRNVHLRPPELLPPMEAFTSTVPSASASASQAGPSSSRTTSTSPAPTPASSTSKLVDPSIKPRTRKLSNNVAHDNVDLLDVTDPLGNNWHHTSPYDALAAPSPVSPDGAERGPRSRLPSAASKPKTNAPSPLSQSTSAVHLAEEPDARPKQKRRRTFKGVFSTRDDIDVHPHPSSLEPVTPFERGASPYLAVPPAGHKHKSSRVPRGLKSMSTTSIPHIATSIFGSHDKDKGAKREKRGSVLGKLAHGFSVLRRPTHSRGGSDTTGMSISDRMSMGTDPSRLSSVPPASGRHLSPEKGEARRRVPVPSVEPSTATSLSPEPDPPAPPRRTNDTQQDNEYVYDSDGHSSLSVEAPYTGGRLTIVNPDLPKPDEVEDSPVSTLMPLRSTSPVARPPSVQVHVQAEIAGMARIQSIKRSSAEAQNAPQPQTAHMRPSSHSHPIRPPSEQSSHSRSASSRLSSQHGGRYSNSTHQPVHARLDKNLPVPAPTPPPFITTEISTSPITLSRPLSVLSPPPVLAPELKPSHSRDSHRSTRKPPSSSPTPLSTLEPAPAHQTSAFASPPLQSVVPTPASSTDTVTPMPTSVSSPPPTTSAIPASPFRREKGASQTVMSSPFLSFPDDTGTPLSRSSLLVNPPTPTAGPMPIPPVARIPSVFARRAKERSTDASSRPRSRSGSTSPTKQGDDEKERREREREAKEKEERERRERERRAEKERLERERAELDRRVREKERQLELERERLEVERRVREKEREIEKERERERERRKAEERERERLAMERERAAEKERLERERVELERRMWERAERERLERDRQRKEQVERERVESERQERERRREEERAEREHRREEERRREKEERERHERDERDRRERERSRERRKERERSRERRKEREREDRERSRERRDREREKEKQRALEKEMHREEREREKERARSRSPFAKRATTSSGAVGSAKARETETFRLVRTLSGGNGISGTTIVAEGQHYELVGEAPKRSKTTSKEDPTRRVSRREKDKEREHRSEDSPAKPVSPFVAHARSASSPVAPTRKESAKRKPSDLPRLRERQPSVSSASNRPTSDLPSAAELHALRARDAWEMDRLWRGHSAAYDSNLMYAQSIAAASTSTVHGGVPMSPPLSGVYEAPYMHGNLAAFTGHTPNYVFPSGLRSYPDLGSIPSIASPEPESLELRSPMRNPLPSPPKPSAFRLPPRVELKDPGLTVASS
ncbi:unnamed protein product [Peniophora sp. CBMAI 1063]|nr:unnamed protein product [Peniophora sp. CBMAI 1063]